MTRTKEQIASRCEAILTAAKNRAVLLGNTAARNALENTTMVTEGYAEPGYSGDVVIFGNWNRVGGWTGAEKPGDKLPEKVSRLLEKAGAEIEWSDEWTTCSSCNRALRTSPDCYSWQRSYATLGDCEEVCEEVCEDCLAERAEEYLESLEGNDRTAVTIDSIDPEEHGYKKLDMSFEHGLYGGQNDRPDKIATALRERGVTRFIFKIDAVGQFDMRFSVFVHESQFHAGCLSEDDAKGADPAIMLKRALESVPAPHNGPGVQYTTINLDDGTAKTTIVSQEDFIRGVRPK